jgi:NAD(P)-dependent dehydrogenase (short-subunit alcohol dehydrogenase family)
MQRLNKKRALITGGDSGIGRAVAIAFASEGADSAIVYHTDEQGAAETKALVEKAGQRCTTIRADVSQEADAARIFAEAIPALGGLDILVNNAAVEKRGEWESFSLADFHRLMEVNLGGYFLMIREALRGKHLQENGRIINTGSIQGLEGSATDPAYSTTKGGIHAMTKSLAKYLIERRILVNCVAPGPVDTPMLKNQSPHIKEKDGGDKYPLGVATPEQIAPAYVFLASADADYLSGQVIALTGGKVTAW